MLVGRVRERQLLESALASDYSQFIAVYGRRRVGKTFLVRESFGYSFAFQHSGLAGGSMREQLFAFCASLEEAGLSGFARPRNWLEAFEALKALIRKSRRRRKVVFIDELSWMDTPRSDLMVALEGFWNGWASARRDVVLVVCASATSWMIDKVVHNKGGLYNRLTGQINLQPFTLGECEELLASRGVRMSRHQVLEGYMVMGGVPFYWEHVRPGLSLSQSVDEMFFARGAPLAREFDYLFASLFRNPRDHLAIVEALAARKAGLAREEIARASGLPNSGALTRRLGELESCGFVRRYRAFGKKSKGSLYQLIDNFTLFHFKFLRDRPSDERYWSNRVNTPGRNAWCGVAFERVCLEHVAQIRRALGVSGVLADVSSWECAADPDRGVEGSQVDLVISRADRVVNLCEMKYAGGEFAVTRRDDRDVRRKVSDFMLATGTRDAVHATLVTTYGLKDGPYSGAFQSVVVADDLFERA